MRAVDEREAGSEIPRGPSTYRFGPYMVDTSRQVLMSGSDVKPIPAKVFAVLLLLLEANGKVVERDTFFEALWQEHAATDGNLAQHVFMLRTLLGEHARDHSYVVTVPGRGYRFAVPAETKVGLVMKGSCERCNRVLQRGDEAYICSYECTFCALCSHELDFVCPNCGGKQVLRPTR